MTFSSVRSISRKVSPRGSWSDESTLVNSPGLDPSPVIFSEGKLDRDQKFKDPSKFVRQPKHAGIGAIEVGTLKRAHASQKENAYPSITLDDKDRNHRSHIFYRPQETRPVLTNIYPEDAADVTNVISSPHDATTSIPDHPESHLRLIRASEDDVLDEQSPGQLWLPSSASTPTNATRKMRGQEKSAVRASLSPSTDGGSTTCNPESLSVESIRRPTSHGSEVLPTYAPKVLPTLRHRQHVHDLRNAFKHRSSIKMRPRPLSEPQISHPTTFEYQLTISMLASLNDKSLPGTPSRSGSHHTPLRKAFIHLRSNLQNIVSF